MASQRERVVVDDAHQLSYDEMKAIAGDCGGFLRTYSRQEDSAEVWHSEKTYVFSGRGLVEFFDALRAAANERIYEALDLCEYIEKSASVPPSVFVRDAVVQRARTLTASIKGRAPEAS